MNRWIVLTAAAALMTPLAGCGGDSAGTGSVAFTTWGEDYIEKAIPGADFEDGWTITYDKFLLVIKDVKVQDREGTTGGEMTGSLLFDHTTAGTKPVVTFGDLEAKAWDHVSYAIGPIDADTGLKGATDADKQTMLDVGASVYVEGAAAKGAVTKAFHWTFTQTTLYDDCKGEKDGKEVDGALVTEGGTDTIELTIHGDHFFYDDLQAATAVRRFDAIASADADNDGEVTLDELTAVPLVSIPEGTYGTGSAGDINDLGAFVVALSRTLGHFRGEGECVSGDP